MHIVTSKTQTPIRITRERWAHIIRRHPEMSGQLHKVAQTVSDPDLIQQGDFGEFLAVRFFAKTPVTRKHLVAAYRETDPANGFIITAYFTNTPSDGRSITWMR